MVKWFSFVAVWSGLHSCDPSEFLTHCLSCGLGKQRSGNMWRTVTLCEGKDCTTLDIEIPMYTLRLIFMLSMSVNIFFERFYVVPSY